MKTTMKTAMLFTAFALLATPVAAQNALDGTWVLEMDSVQPSDRPAVLLLQNDSYVCQSCTPVQTLKTDGQFHPITNDPYSDAMSVRVIDARTVARQYRQGEVVVAESTDTISADGQQREYAFTDRSNANGTPVTGRTISRRVADGPAGAHALSGGWQVIRYEGFSDEVLRISLRVDGDTLHMTSPLGERSAARFNGPSVPVEGDSSGLTVAVIRADPSTIVQIGKRNGQVVDVTTMSVAPDGRTLDIVSQDAETGATMSYRARKS